MKPLLEPSSLNEVNLTVMILEVQLEQHRSNTSRIWRAGNTLDDCCALACSLNERALTKLAAVLEGDRYGILHHCDYSNHTGLLEGINHQIKATKRRVYGLRNLCHFTLKIFQICYN